MCLDRSIQCVRARFSPLNMHKWSKWTRVRDSRTLTPTHKATTTPRNDKSKDKMKKKKKHLSQYNERLPRRLTFKFIQTIKLSGGVSDWGAEEHAFFYFINISLLAAPQWRRNRFPCGQAFSRLIESFDMNVWQHNHSARNHGKEFSRIRLIVVAVSLRN